jgi:hypothetical protein
MRHFQNSRDRLAKILQQLIYTLALRIAAGECRNLASEPARGFFVNHDGKRAHIDRLQRLGLNKPLPVVTARCSAELFRVIVRHH